MLPFVEASLFVIDDDDDVAKILNARGGQGMTMTTLQMLFFSTVEVLRARWRREGVGEGAFMSCMTIVVWPRPSHPSLRCRHGAQALLVCTKKREEAP